MKKWVGWWLALAIMTVSPAGWTATTYTMKVTPSMPPLSAGATLLATQPSSTLLSPCSSATQVDAVTFTLNYNAGTGTGLLDVYLIFFNPNADGVYSAQFYVVSRSSLASGGLALVPRYTVSELVPSTDMYLAREANPGGAIKETLLGSFIDVDGVPAGTWQLVGIVADRATVNFDNPSTWTAWDVGTVILRKPWPGLANTLCQ